MRDSAEGPAVRGTSEDMPVPPNRPKAAPHRLQTVPGKLAWRAWWSMPRSWSYPIVGVILAFGAPAGLLVARAASTGHAPEVDWAVTDIDRLQGTYAYVTASTMAIFALLGWMLGRSFDRVRVVSITDPLTGAFNRRHFEQRMAEEVARGRRHRRVTSVLFVDIDRLKAINDSLGHKAGDRAILAVSRVLLQNVRAIDAVARVGGDEFAVLLPETTETQASTLSRRILEGVARHGDTSIGELAVSIGVTELDAGAEADLDDMLAVADAALYRAKAAGGGHVAVARVAQAASGRQHASLMAGSQLIDDDMRAGAPLDVRVR